MAMVAAIHLLPGLRYTFELLYLKINVDRGGAETDAAHRGRAKRGATGFGLGIVVMDAWEVCGPVGTGAAGYQGIVTCCGRRVQLWKPGFIFHGARVTEGTCLQAWMARWYLGVMA